MAKKLQSYDVYAGSRKIGEIHEKPTLEHFGGLGPILFLILFPFVIAAGAVWLLVKFIIILVPLTVAAVTGTPGAVRVLVTELPGEIRRKWRRALIIVIGLSACLIGALIYQLELYKLLVPAPTEAEISAEITRSLAGELPESFWLKDLLPPAQHSLIPTLRPHVSVVQTPFSKIRRDLAALRVSNDNSYAWVKMVDKQGRIVVQGLMAVFVEKNSIRGHIISLGWFYSEDALKASDLESWFSEEEWAKLQSARSSVQP